MVTEDQIQAALQKSKNNDPVMYQELLSLVSTASTSSSSYVSTQIEMLVTNILNPKFKEKTENIVKKLLQEMIKKSSDVDTAITSVSTLLRNLQNAVNNDNEQIVFDNRVSVLLQADYIHYLGKMKEEGVFPLTYDDKALLNILASSLETNINTNTATSNSSNISELNNTIDIFSNIYDSNKRVKQEENNISESNKRFKQEELEEAEFNDIAGIVAELYPKEAINYYGLSRTTRDNMLRPNIERVLTPKQIKTFLYATYTGPQLAGLLRDNTLLSWDEYVDITNLQRKVYYPSIYPKALDEKVLLNNIRNRKGSSQEVNEKILEICLENGMEKCANILFADRSFVVPIQLLISGTSELRIKYFRNYLEKNPELKFSIEFAQEVFANFYVRAYNNMTRSDIQANERIREYIQLILQRIDPMDRSNLMDNDEVKDNISKIIFMDSEKGYSNFPTKELKPKQEQMLKLILSDERFYNQKFLKELIRRFRNSPAFSNYFQFALQKLGLTEEDLNNIKIWYFGDIILPSEQKK